jgi:hypothetical protein
LAAFSASQGHGNAAHSGTEDVNKMGIAEKIKERLVAAGVTVDDKVLKALDGVDGSADFNDAEDLRRQVAEFAADKRKRTAKEMAEKVVRDGKALPAEFAAIEAAFLQAIEDDEANPVVVTFSVDGKETKGNRVQTLEAVYAARPAHDLTKELLGGGAALFNDGGDKVDAERIKRLKAMTPLGRACDK